MFWKTPFTLLGLLAAGTNAAPFAEVGNHLAPRNLQDLLSANPSTILYRGDTRSWDQIRAAGGLFPYNEPHRDYSVYRHVSGVNQPQGVSSAYVSASSSEEWVRVYLANALGGPGAEEFTIYKIAPGPNFMSTLQVLGGKGNLPPNLEGEDQQEYLALGGIPIEQIMGYYKYKRVWNDLHENYEWVDEAYDANPAFDGTTYPRPISKADHRLAGFPRTHEAWTLPPFAAIAAQFQGQPTIGPPRTKRETTTTNSRKDTPQPPAAGKPKNTKVADPKAQGTKVTPPKTKVSGKPQSTSKTRSKGVTYAATKLPEIIFRKFVKELLAKGYEAKLPTGKSVTGTPLTRKLTKGKPTTGEPTTRKPTTG